jgi:surfactin synthase thioesterase subunit
MTATSPERTPYLPQAPDAAAPLRLFCFHHAGGSASVFNGWRQALGPAVSVVPVQLPGREKRFGEPRVRHLPTLVRELDTHLDPYLRQPYAFYGHSMGALLAYTLTSRRAAAGRSLPERLVVGALPAPHRPHVLADTDGLDDEEFTRRLVDLGGISPTLLDYPRWLAAAARLARDDLRLVQGPPLTAWEPLPCPIEVFTGEDDPLMREGDADEWFHYTRATFRVTRLPGGHFFPWDDPDRFLARLAAALPAVPGAMRRGTPA